MRFPARFAVRDAVATVLLVSLVGAVLDQMLVVDGFPGEERSVPVVEFCEFLFGEWREVHGGVRLGRHRWLLCVWCLPSLGQL